MQGIYNPEKRGIKNSVVPFFTNRACVLHNNSNTSKAILILGSCQLQCLKKERSNYLTNLTTYIFQLSYQCV